MLMIIVTLKCGSKVSQVH